MNNYDDFEQYDETESVWKIDGPIGRLDYFWVFLGTTILLLFVILLKSFFGMLLFPLMIVILGISFWLYFVATAKRFFDITGDKKNGVIITIILLLVNLFFQPVCYLSIGICLLIKGKYIK